jgi:Planctomycete cytochrome C
MGLYAAGLLALSSCADDATAPGRPQCLTADPTDLNCLPLYPPEFGEIFHRTLNVTCASTGVSCHGQDGSMGNLVFVNMTDSYDALLGQKGGTRRVIPGDPACSELMVRLDSLGKDWSMPPGTPLDERARCAIRRWIAAGAPPPSLDGGR